MSDDDTNIDADRDASESQIALTIRGFDGLGVLVRIAGGAAAIAALSVHFEWTPEQITQVVAAFGAGGLAVARRPQGKR